LYSLLLCSVSPDSNGYAPSSIKDSNHVCFRHVRISNLSTHYCNPNYFVSWILNSNSCSTLGYYSQYTRILFPTFSDVISDTLGYYFWHPRLLFQHPRLLFPAPLDLNSTPLNLISKINTISAQFQHYISTILTQFWHPQILFTTSSIIISDTLNYYFHVMNSNSSLRNINLFIWFMDLKSVILIYQFETESWNINPNLIKPNLTSSHWFADSKPSHRI